MKISIIKGDGIGPSIMEATLKILTKVAPDLEFEEIDLGLEALSKHGELIPKQSLDSIRKNKIALKSPLETPSGKGFSSINVSLRKEFNLFANIRPIKTISEDLSPLKNSKDIDMVILRENTEGLYSGEGQYYDDKIKKAFATSVMSEEKTIEFLEFAFNYCLKNNRKKLTLIHKANILKTTSGLFLRIGQELSKKYPIEFNTMIADAANMNLVKYPQYMDVLATTNFIGDILSDGAAGLIGGLGLAPGANVGKDVAIFEAIHGTAPDIAGKNLANPSALILSAALMLEHIGRGEAAKKVKEAVAFVCSHDARRTKDIGGEGSTDSMTTAILERL